MKNIKCFVVNSHAITSESKHFRTRHTLAMIVATCASCQNPKVICTMAYKYSKAVTEVGRLIKDSIGEPQTWPARCQHLRQLASQTNESSIVGQ